MITFGGIGNAFSERNFRIYTVGSITSWISFFIHRASNAFGILIIGTAADYFGLFYPIISMLIFCLIIWLWLFKRTQGIHDAF